MQYRLIIIGLMVLCASSAVAQQQDSQREKQRVAVIPPEQSLLAVASQPDCPLRFEGVKLIYSIDEHRAGVSFELRNRGTKTLRIKSFAFAVVFSDGGGWSSGKAVEADKLVAPGQVVPIQQDYQEEFVPLANELRDKLKLQGPMKDVAILIIKSVEFADGSTYSGEATLKALQTYFEKLGSKAGEH